MYIRIRDIYIVYLIIYACNGNFKNIGVRIRLDWVAESLRASGTHTHVHAFVPCGHGFNPFAE